MGDGARRSDGDLWTRLSGVARPSAAIATLENSATVARLVTGTLFGASFLTALMGLLFFYFGEPLAGWATIGLSAAYLGTWIWYASTGRVFGPAVLSAVASIANQVAVHLALGGYAYSGAYLAWGITLTFALVIMLGRREAVAVAVLQGIIAIVLAFFESTLITGRPAPAQSLRIVLFVQVIVGNLAMVTAVLVFFMRRLAEERQRAETLLLNVLPSEVAGELKERGSIEPKRFDSISVVFADIVGFTQRYAGADPGEMVGHLNDIFSHFDALAATYGCEKIRTIGDAYMVACGVPGERPDHAQAAAALALDMLGYASTGPLEFRIGINSGPVIAGVIGTSKFQYDVWGDTVNTASRMESHGVPGRIQIAEATYRLIADDFECVPRGTVEVKGKGSLRTWFLEGRRVD